ncbi:MAG: hypothetical protein RBG13Loki_1496 [Promethearchaeota archaeon CR_4]|nr:MAG: hypothetical protein RBG13Loki_1496 [Candidatus Lokiarchaeota archaeon CR_4]
MQTIALSFFHRKIGPIVVYNYPETLDEVNKLRIADIMDQAYEEGFFTHSFGDLTSMNYYFEIFSSWARGNKEMVMVSVVLNNEVPSDLEHLLLSWTIDFATKLRNNMEIFKGFYLSDEENFSAEDRVKIREMNNQLILWVKELYWVTLEETREKSQEEKMATLLKERDVFFSIQKLAKRPILYNQLKEWYNSEFPGLDFPKFLEKVEKEKFVVVNEIGQDTYVLLVKQPNIIRVPPDCVIALYEDKPEYEDFLNNYIVEIQKFFDAYVQTTEDSLKLLDIIANPKMYNVLMQLRTGPIQLEKISEVLIESSLKTIVDTLKIMEECQLIEEITFDDEKYLILLSDVQFKTAFPDYLAKSIQEKKESLIKQDVSKEKPHSQKKTSATNANKEYGKERKVKSKKDGIDEDTDGSQN